MFHIPVWPVVRWSAVENVGWQADYKTFIFTMALIFTTVSSDEQKIMKVTFFYGVCFFLHKLPLHAHTEMASVRQTVRQQKVPLLTNGRNKKKTISTTTSLSFHETICFHLSPGGGKNSYGRRTAGRRSEIMFKMSTGRPFLHCTQPEIIAMNQQSRPVLLAYVDRVAFPTSMRYKVPKWTALWNRVFFCWLLFSDTTIHHAGPL